MDTKAQAQETPIVGEEELKVLTRHDYEEEIMRIAGQICSMATKAGDTVTAGQTEFTPSQLDKMSADDLERVGKRVSGLVTANLAALADFNITQTDGQGLDGMTAQFDKVKTGPRTAIAKRAGQTRTLPPAVKSVVSLLRNHLDKEMLMFKKSNPEFYAGYLSARVVIDRHGKGNATPTPAPAPAAKPQK